MTKHDKANSVNRRLFLGGSALIVLGLPDIAGAQAPEAKTETPAKGNGANAKRIRRMLAEFVVGFDPKTVPAAVVDLCVYRKFDST